MRLHAPARLLMVFKHLCSLSAYFPVRWLLQARARKAALSKAHNEDWSSAATKLKEGVAELCLYHVASLQASLALTSAKYAFAKWLLEHIGSQRKQHSKVDKYKEGLYNSMRTAVQRLLEWVPQLNFYRSSLRNDPDVQSMLASTAVTADATGALIKLRHQITCCTATAMIRVVFIGIACVAAHLRMWQLRDSCCSAYRLQICAGRNTLCSAKVVHLPFLLSCSCLGNAAAGSQQHSPRSSLQQPVESAV
jgi:hypothetical protein